MCLTITKDAVLQTATKDIKVYKHLIPSDYKDIYFTSYRSVAVEMGITYHSDIEVEELIHKNLVQKGLHSYKHKRDAELSAIEYEEDLVECIIPKGAKYYTGTFEDRGTSFASDTLKYVRIIKSYKHVAYSN